jgi:hypothetical protein
MINKISTGSCSIFDGVFRVTSVVLCERLPRQTKKQPEVRLNIAITKLKKQECFHSFHLSSDHRKKTKNNDKACFSVKKNCGTEILTILVRMMENSNAYRVRTWSINKFTRFKLSFSRLLSN